ncbi:adenosylmethionine decarboxylase [Geomonas sp. Red32]|uniref:adenosylmethionine decarboxylase n=1 Tax=Geomonas sp. Red32 TaxID=2912856 RepID=UPI00202CA75F|nr:adenosylmethionine decarboxylase [Geomonas sp. Red32]MCM0083027.1 adenosylmethionine decarboxylase [Geomonas sp. Red32]
MKRFGTHFIVDGWLAPADLLNDAEAIRAALLEAVEAAGATLIELCVHRFSPVGVTATATLAESHIALHTWPEEGYFAADFFFCGSGNPKDALLHLTSALGAEKYAIREVERGRGLLPPGQGSPHEQ